MALQSIVLWQRVNDVGEYPVLFNIVLVTMSLVVVCHVYEIVFKRHYDSIPATWRARLRTTEKWLFTPTIVLCAGAWLILNLNR